MSTVNAVVFDFGGVVAMPPPPDWALYGLMEEIGLSRKAWQAGFARWRSAWDGDDISGEEMYARILDENGIVHTPELLTRLIQADAAGWAARMNPRTLELAARFKAEGKKIALLSNMSTSFYAGYYLPKAAAFHTLADVEVVSGRERVCKPDPRIFRIAEKRLALPPSRLLFFDDNLGNVEAARACGWHAELYRSA